MNKVSVSVINDLVTDQRVHKVCMSLTDFGFSVSLVGRVLASSPAMDKRSYKTKRMRLLFTKGPLFYAFFNIRLFFYLLLKKSDLLVSNDLDTLLANYLISKIKRIPLVYDSHEYFTEVPELEGRTAKKVWLAIERWIFPKLKDVITVNDSIAAIYNKKYGVDVKVIRNLPLKPQQEIIPFEKDEFGIDTSKKVVILQGSGINLDRGGEEAVLAMKQVENAVLFVVGSGDALLKLKQIAKDEMIEDKVFFFPRQTPERLLRYTAMADVGLSLDKNTNLNYRFSLPNKIFDYINCGVPVLASNLPEVAKIVNDYGVGLVLNNYSVDEISIAINRMLSSDLKEELKENLKKASQALCWQNNQDILLSIYKKFHMS